MNRRLIHSQLLLVFLLFTVLFFPMSAQAHSEGHSAGFMHGFTHPLGGLDHLAAMVAVGLWATQMGRRAIWAVPLTFVLVMVLGGFLGTAGLAIPFVEQGIAYSVLVLGVLIAAMIRVPIAVSASIVGLFAIFHGYAHGAEMPPTASGVAYGLGFAVATALIHLNGIGLGLLCQNLFRDNLRLTQRFVGGIIISLGVYLCLS
ncbi:MAG: HupE/UreJ family protein [Acaryochloris sp. RU_4_1]|nr:HupE/UreJ family protein [Acaryochloris sp. RU_4_1]NJR54205.1 HupE/UreJ family protein [Acaryochloris sp. CRU_2_0]